MTYAERAAQEVLQKQMKGRTLLREDIAFAIQAAMEKQAVACMKAGAFFAQREFGWQGNEDKLILLQDKIHFAEVEQNGH